MKQKVIFTNSIKTKKKRKKLLFKRIRFALIICALFAMGFFFKGLIIPNKDGKDSIQPVKEALNENVASTNAVDKPNSIDYNNLKTEISNYLKNYGGQYGVYFYDIKTGNEFGINDEDEFIAASMIKVPLNLCLYEKVKSGSVNLDGTMTYLKEDYEEGTGDLQSEKFGSKYSVRELSKLSLTTSDNVAANILIRLLGKYTLKDYMRQVGGKDVDEYQNVSTPKDMGLYMKLAYEFYKSEGALGKEFMDNLLNTYFNDRLPALLPKTVKVAHKIGTQEDVVNDVGIIFTDSPYILSIMSKDVSEDEAANVLANISKKIYDFVVKQP